jgi:hypothetical protein
VRLLSIPPMSPMQRAVDPCMGDVALQRSRSHPLGCMDMNHGSPPCPDE